jgi:hypothetical protein
MPKDEPGQQPRSPADRRCAGPAKPHTQAA